MKATISIEDAVKKVVARYGEKAAEYIEAAAVRKEIIYDEYIHTDTLLSLQQPMTEYHDDLTFLIYHQQTELWFRLALHEMNYGIEKLLETPANIVRATESALRTSRILNFCTQSFDILIDGLDTNEFLEFRKAFGSSSGFQSAQFRAIEIVAGLERKAKGEDKTFYWENAARDLETGEPTLTLVNFKENHLQWLNEMYDKREPYSFRMAFERVLREQSDKKDLREMYLELFNGTHSGEIKQLAEELVKLDTAIVEWKRVHLRAAAKHLARAPRGTGETNWAEYLSRSITEEHYFPELVTAMKEASNDEEIESVTLADA